MKMDSKLYAELESAIRSFLSARCLSEDEVTEHYHARGLSLKRARWDAYKFGTSRLYDAGLNDEHIDTSIRKILYHPAD